MSVGSLLPLRFLLVLFAALVNREQTSSLGDRIEPWKGLRVRHPLQGIRSFEFSDSVR